MYYTGSTHALKVTCPATQSLDIRGLITGELDIHPAVMQLLLDERECASVIGIRKTDLVQRLGREGIRQGLHVLAIVAYNDDMGNLQTQ